MVEQEVTASLQGEIGETLLKRHKNAIEEDMTDELIEILDGRPEGYTHNVRFDIARTPFTYDVYIDGDYASWRPDALYELTFYGERRHDRHSVEFPAEIKTGEYAELTDNQRAVMETISRRDESIVPIRIRVSIDDLPDEFSYVVSPITSKGVIAYSPDTSSEGSHSTEITTQSTTESPSDDDSALSDFITNTVSEEVIEVLLSGGEETTHEELKEGTSASWERIEDELEELRMSGHIYENTEGVYLVVDEEDLQKRL